MHWYFPCIDHHPIKAMIMLNMLPLMTAFSNFSFSGVYGGYLRVESPLKLLYRTDFLWLKPSNENLPWYEPIPLSPTPPKGKLATATCNVTG